MNIGAGEHDVWHRITGAGERDIWHRITLVQESMIYGIASRVSGGGAGYNEV